MEQQQVLVQELRDKILENVISAKESQKRSGAMASGPGGAAEQVDIRIRNVNLLLHALNLDAAQISV
jgi:DNA topoisomerase 2-associated protein PAT1